MNFAKKNSFSCYFLLFKNINVMKPNYPKVTSYKQNYAQRTYGQQYISSVNHSLLLASML